MVRALRAGDKQEIGGGWCLIRFTLREPLVSVSAKLYRGRK